MQNVEISHPVRTEPSIEILSPPNEHDIQVARQTLLFVHDVISQTAAAEMLPPDMSSQDAIEQTVAAYHERPKSTFDIDSKPYALLRYGSVAIMSDSVDKVTGTSPTKEDVERVHGFVDEDSFAFVWDLLSITAEYEELPAEFERTCLDMVVKMKRFLDTSDGLDRVAEDPRLRDPLHMYVAVEAAQRGDFEQSLVEIEAISEPRMRSRLTEILQETVGEGPMPISVEESEENFRRGAGKAGVASFLYELEGKPPITTEIATSMAPRAFVDMLDPFSNGRYYPDSVGSQNYYDRRPSQGDGVTRVTTEGFLGHPRSLFRPRVVYGVVVESEYVAADRDNGWAFGNVRVVLRPDSRAAQSATYTFGDSKNGEMPEVIATHRLARDDADRAAYVLRRGWDTSTVRTGSGTTAHYVEAQYEGLTVQDIKEVIIRNDTKAEAADKETVLEAAELAAMQGVESRYIYSWDEMRHMPGTESYTDETYATDLLEIIEQRMEKFPHVKFQISVGSQETKDILDRIVGGVGPDIVLETS